MIVLGRNDLLKPYFKRDDQIDSYQVGSIATFNYIRPEMRNAETKAVIEEKGEEKEKQARYGIASVSWATLKDETGSIRGNLWREQIDMMKVGAEVRL